MRVPYSWLREYCDPGVEPAELAERLAMTGTEVERVGTVGPPSSDNFVVGRVVGCEKHPDADRLSVCTVDTGDGDPRTIVCGAPNVAAGQTVAVALPGATMPGGATLGRAAQRDGAPDAAARTGDERKLALEPFHACVSRGSPAADALSAKSQVSRRPAAGEGSAKRFIYPCSARGCQIPALSRSSVFLACNGATAVLKSICYPTVPERTEQR